MFSFSTAVGGPDNVSAQKAFLEEKGRYSACDVIILSLPNQPVGVGVVLKHIVIGAEGFGFDFWARTGR